MKFLKGLALTALNLLLFLALSVFGLVLTLNYTILNPDFVTSEVDRLDACALAKEALSQQIPGDEPYITEALDNTFAELEPWLKEQVNSNINSGYDYLLGKSGDLTLNLPMQPVADALKSNTREAILNTPPLELAGMSPAAVEMYLEEVSRQIDEMLPPSFEFGLSSMSPEVRAQLEQAREITGYVQLGYKALIGLILLLVGLIILINREVRSSTRSLGITFLISGASGYAGAIIAPNLVQPRLAQLGLPAQIQGWLPQLISDFVTPLQMLGIGLVAGGVVLIIVSFAYKSRQPSF